LLFCHYKTKTFAFFFKLFLKIPRTIEDELFKEIKRLKIKGIKRLFQKKHKLNEYNFSAVAKSMKNDEVLFAIHKNNLNEFDHAIIKLTWKGSFEYDDTFPYVEFFESFDHFLNSRTN
jgi:hypothetical protein